MINLRPAAVQELKRLLRAQPGQPPQVRLHLQLGGCLEWTYQLRSADVALESEVMVDCGDLGVLVANPLLPYLQGLTIDFSEDLMGGGFRFVNPQAAQTCGCGNSFSLTAGHLSGDCQTPAADPPRAAIG
ncbi:MAG: iron-sulfur cluster assembly accessory protein [Leptolyngbyaceae cyanobacterium SM2_5_2]|nr:iron-sulfur cluster assembly accessory protein [Leptolyngbyaceae cyanobacterium SM2_5_2]